MANLDLRPLSLGEILDRTFSIYRGNFLLFVGITAIPQLLILGLHLAQILLTMRTPGQKVVSGTFLAFGLIGALSLALL
jgi:hypothetical protein